MNIYEVKSKADLKREVRTMPREYDITRLELYIEQLPSGFCQIDMIRSIRNVHTLKTARGMLSSRELLTVKQVKRLINDLGNVYVDKIGVSIIRETKLNEHKSDSSTKAYIVTYTPKEA